MILSATLCWDIDPQWFVSWHFVMKWRHPSRDLCVCSSNSCKVKLRSSLKTLYKLNSLCRVNVKVPPSQCHYTLMTSHCINSTLCVEWTWKLHLVNVTIHSWHHIITRHHFFLACVQISYISSYKLDPASVNNWFVHNSSSSGPHIGKHILQFQWWHDWHKKSNEPAIFSISTTVTDIVLVQTDHL